MAANRVIGVNGGLPWKIPEDTKFFRDMTMGHIMLMGRKTFESFGRRPLPKRLHVVITRQRDYRPEGCVVCHSPEEALTYCQSQTAKWGNEVFLIGGAEIYAALLDKTDRIYLTEIHAEFSGDSYFPEFSAREFRETARSVRREPVAFDFVTYDRVPGTR